MINLKQALGFFFLSLSLLLWSRRSKNGFSLFLLLLVSCSHPPAGQLVEHVGVQLLVGVLGPHGEEDVAADELVDHLAVGGEAVEDDVALVVELDHHVLRLPVHVPSLTETNKKKATH